MIAFRRRTVDKGFAATLFIRPHVVLGRRLRPFSLRLSARMEALELSDYPQARSDLAALVRLCAARPMRRWRSWCWLRAWSLRLALFPEWIDAECLFWRAYIAEHTTGPECFRPENGVPVRTPWQLFRVAQLVRFGRMSPDAAWDMPLGLALWYCEALSEAGGAKSELITDEIREVMRAAGHEVGSGTV